MRVLCIRGVKSGDKGILSGSRVITANKDWEIYEGESYNVIKEELGHKGNLVYRLRERVYNARYAANRFIPLSSIDEIKMERNYKTEKVCTKLSK